MTDNQKLMEHKNDKIVLEFTNPLVSKETRYKTKNLAVLGFIKLVLKHNSKYDDIYFKTIIPGKNWRMKASLSEFFLDLGEISEPIEAKIYTDNESFKGND